MLASSGAHTSKNDCNVWKESLCLQFSAALHQWCALICSKPPALQDNSLASNLLNWHLLGYSTLPVNSSQAPGRQWPAPQCMYRCGNGVNRSIIVEQQKSWPC